MMTVIVKLTGLTKRKAIKKMLAFWHTNYRKIITAKEFSRMCSIVKEKIGFSIIYKGPGKDK